MKKIYLFLFITCIISVNSIDARSIAEIPSVPVETSVNADQYDLEILAKALNDLGFEIKDVGIYADPTVKKCTVTIKGKFNGIEIEVVVVIEGKTCSELLKEVMKK